MSQHDMTVDNAGAATVRVDMNSALQALASTSSGATAPTTTFANQFWYDTSTNILKKRNADNDAWINFATFDESGDLLSSIILSDLTSSGNITNSLIRKQPYYIENLGFSLSTQTVTVHASDGSALSSSNPGYICMPSNSSPGNLILYTITANQTMTNTEMNGNTFGTTGTTAWGNSLPLYLYVCSNDNEDAISFCWGRIPHMKVSPSSGNMGDPSSATANLEYSLYAFDDIVETSYDNNNCFALGSLTATKDASDVWVFDMMVEGKDGIGLFNEETDFIFPDGQNGAAASKNMKDNLGTAPGFSARYYAYQVRKNGRCRCLINNEGASSNGSGAVTALLALPYQNHNANARCGYGSAHVQWNTSSHSTVTFHNSGTRGEVEIWVTGGGSLTNADFTGSKGIDGFVDYKIHNGS